MREIYPSDILSFPYFTLTTRYCDKCGRVCKIELHDTRRYDKINGRRLYNIGFRCPEKRWWNTHYSAFVYGGFGPYSEKRDLSLEEILFDGHTVDIIE